MIAAIAPPFWSPVAQAANTVQATSSSPGLTPADPASNIDFFGLKLGADANSATAKLNALVANCIPVPPAVQAAACRLVNDSPDLCKTTVFDGTPVPNCQSVVTLRTEQKGQWSSVLRVFFTAKLNDPGSQVFRIEWWVYWLDKDQWLMSVRERMRDRVLAGLPSSCERSYPDHGATHRFIWRGPGKENALKSYVAFDVSYWPQMMLVASRGDFDERYALRLAAYKKQWQSQTDQEETAPTDARKFLSRKDASSPWLPLPSQ